MTPLDQSAQKVLVPAKLARMLEAQGIPGEALVPWEGELPPPEAIAAADAAILWHQEPAKLARYLLAHKEHWEWMHSLWTGLEHLPVARLHRAVRTFTTGKGTGAVPLAEWVLAALLWHAKRLSEVDRAFRQGSWEPTELGELWGSKVVVLGLGTIGRAVAQTLSKLGVQVIGVRRKPQATRGCQEVVSLAALTSALRQARALVIVLPATPATAGLVNAQVLAALPDGALVVNIGRAVVVDEAALLAEVASGRLWAALDVWWQEPLPKESPWRQLPQLLPSPHNAYRGERFLQRHFQRVVENVRLYLDHRPLRFPVGRREWAELLGHGGDTA